MSRSDSGELLLKLFYTVLFRTMVWTFKKYIHIIKCSHQIISVFLNFSQSECRNNFSDCLDMSQILWDENGSKKNLKNYLNKSGNIIISKIIKIILPTRNYQKSTV
jgi:hypothetical protein